MPFGSTAFRCSDGHCHHRRVIELRTEGARLQVVPEIGGRLHQLWLTVHGREEPLLVSPEDPSGHGTEPLTGGSYPMAPWANRIAGAAFRWGGRNVALPANEPPHALHGLVFDRPWEVVARVGRVLEMRCDFDERWPWEGYAWQRVELQPGGLLIKAEVRSRREAFPAGIGLHPWFRRDVAGAEDVLVRIPARQRYVAEAGIPTGALRALEGSFDLRDLQPLGARPLDDCYTLLDDPVELDWGRLRLEIDVECAQPHVMVYATPEAICVEPQTCAPDAFNLRTRLEGTGFATAEPGRAVALASRWRWRIM